MGRKPRVEISQEMIDIFIRLRRTGVTNKEIAARYNVAYDTVKRHMTRELGVRRITKQELEEIAAEVANDRLTMTRAEVAKKWNKTVRWVNRILKDSDQKSNFKPSFNPRKKKVSKEVKQKVNAIKKAKDKEIKAKEKEESQKVFKKREFGPTKTLRVDHKTEIQVPITDDRPNTEIIEEWKRKNVKKISPLKI